MTGGDARRAWPSLQAWRADADGVLRGEAGAVTGIAASEPSHGICGLCGRESNFGAAGTDGDMREGLHCMHCGCNARQRAAAVVLLAALPDPGAARVHATEQTSRLFLALRRRLRHLSGSEYAPTWRTRLRLSRWLLRHGVPAWVRHGDVTALAQQDAELDALISLDVLEHVSDFRAALREFARVLRAGGVLVLTVPFYEGQARSERIARQRDDGGIEHLGEPEYHGDPLAGRVPCFHHFGWDLLDAMREAGFGQAEAVRVFDPARGLPQGLWVLRARR
jgi:SAM-dependent methyltransferase